MPYFSLVFSLLMAIVDDVLPIKIDWTVKMGDKPTPREPEIHCFNSFWKDGRMADYCIATFLSIEPSPYWNKPYPKFLDGTHYCKLSTSCRNWHSTRMIGQGGLPMPAATIWDDNGRLEIVLFTELMGKLAFGNHLGALPQQNFENLISPSTQPYYNGCCTIEWFFDGNAPPLSWAAASAAGVPASKGYLAEQGYSGLDDNHYRYCAAHNKTNIKIILGDE